MNSLTPVPAPARSTWVRHLCTRACASVMLIALAGPALGDQADSLGYIGLGGMDEPAFAGADKRRLRAIPMIDISSRYLLVNTTRGMPEFGVNVAEGAGLKLAAIASIDLGRKASDSPILLARQADDIDPFPSVGLVASWDTSLGPVPVELLLRPMRRLGDSDGWTTDLRLAVGLAELGAFSAQAHAQTTWANGRAQQADFGLLINPAQPDPSDFEPGAGLRESRFGLSANYLLSDRFRLLMQVERRVLDSDLGQSELVERRSATTYALGLAWSL